MFRRRDEERRLSYRLSRPLLMISMMASQFLPFSRKHCTLTTTLEMGYIYSTHLHFLSNLLKCPVGQHRKWHFQAPKFKNFRGACPETVIPPALERLRTSNFFFLCVHLQNLKLRFCYTNLENLLLKTV